MQPAKSDTAKTGNECSRELCESLAVCHLLSRRGRDSYFLRLTIELTPETFHIAHGELDHFPSTFKQSELQIRRASAGTYLYKTH